MNCRLCRFSKTVFLGHNGNREFFACQSCGLVFVPEEYFLSFSKEKERYAMHHNTLSDMEYVEYLGKVVAEIVPLVPDGGKVIDFGCGKEAVLVSLIKDAGIACDGYDPLYRIGDENLGCSYDLVVLCEVVEHIRDLSETIKLLSRITGSGGKIYIKTRFFHQDISIKEWWYAKDPTHINFFSHKAIEWMATKMQKSIISINDRDTVIVG